MSSRDPDGHGLVGCDWHHRSDAWVALCRCGWQSGPRDYSEEALSAFRHHRMDVLGWTVVRPHPKGR